MQLKPKAFKEANVELKKPDSMTDEECGSLFVHTDGKTCVSLWNMTWRDRIRALWYGKIWLGVMTGKSQPPVWVDCGKTIFVDMVNPDYCKANFDCKDHVCRIESQVYQHDTQKVRETNE